MAMKVIGLTGGIGSGKSTVAQILAELGAIVMDSDKIGHEVLQDDAAKQEIAAAFGKEVLDKDNNIDRKKLSAAVFGNAAALAKLNAIVHPRMDVITLQRIEDYKLQNAKAVVLEIPLLVESGLSPMMDEIWITIVSEATVLKRIQKRSGLTEDETRARIRSQMAPEELKKLADVVIDTDCTLEELREKVKKQWERLINQSTKTK